MRTLVLTSADMFGELVEKALPFVTIDTLLSAFTLFLTPDIRKGRPR